MYLFEWRAVIGHFESARNETDPTAITRRRNRKEQVFAEHFCARGRPEMMMANLASLWCPAALLALSASERWSAVRHLKPDTSTPTWLIAATAAVLIVLLVSAFVIRHSQRPRKSVPRRR